MQRNRIVIDCDPGIDDTFALAANKYRSREE